MRKGDIKKQEILSAAEELFCRKGYEQTGVQEIIDRTRSSKGSFYHHFPSKESILEGICRTRAGQIYSAAAAEAEKTERIDRRLDALLSGMIPMREEKLSFLLMLLPVFCLPEGRLVRDYYSNALSDAFHEAVCTQIKKGAASGELFCSDPENTVSIILSLVNGLWIRITGLIIESENRGTEPDLSEALRMTECSRLCIERFLSMPYGSVSLIDFPTLRNLAEKIHHHWAQS